ncbi:MAG: polysaccharide biosynthesis C-terminal domain-containing protein [Bacteroidetes bacterium]|nr:polysaccharide biosynthesis C-terminal domain-containing protein [Bacteroidota bacterium]
MSNIRKRSLKAAVWIYAGFVIGAVNTYILTHKSWFTTDQNGLTRALIEISQLVFAFSTFGVTTFLYKFFPYYKDNLKPKENDILSIAIVVALIGFTITSTGMFFLEPVITRKFSENSLLLVQYIYWTLPMGFFVLLYYILESYSYGFDKGVITNLLKETVLRLYTLIILLLKISNLISFRTFIILFSFQYLIIVLILLYILHSRGELYLNFHVSKVTKKYRRKIFSILSLTFIVIVVGVLRQSIDGLVLAAKQNLGKVGIFGLAAYMVSVLQAPFRSMIAITIPILSRAWKEKKLNEIERIYKRSSINLLSFSLFVFFCIWLNFTDAINYFGINSDYLEGKWVFFMLGTVSIVEMGTGVNSQIIGTSTYWRFELWTNILLTILIIPLSYFLTVKYGITGPAIANLLSFTVYNFIRFYFLWKKFNLQPFSQKTIEVLLIAIGGYVITYFLFNKIQGLTALVCRSIFFSTIYLVAISKRNITPDLSPILLNLRKKLPF